MIGELTPRSALSTEDVGDMYRLFRGHFERVTERCFQSDLERKHWVIRIRDGQTLYGFTSLQFVRATADGHDLNVLYSGDTIVSPQARSTTLLARTWIDSVRRLSRYYGATDLHWLLLVSGFRTYRLLPVFWKEFYPHHAQPTPASVRATIDTVASSMFGQCYSAQEGIVRLAEPQPLRAQVSQIPASRLEDPHVRFFATNNPRHFDGDELVCWTRLSYDNLTEAGARMWRAGDLETPLSRAV